MTEIIRITRDCNILNDINYLPIFEQFNNIPGIEIFVLY